MSQPPDEEQTGEEGPVLEEPPFDVETDTRPLKPLHLKRDQEREASPRDGSLAGDPPPATVLRGSPPGGTGRRARPLLPVMDDTHRVRLIPKIPNPPPWRIILQVDGPGQTTIGLDVRQPLVIGRLDPDGEHDPDLDLTSHLASEHGVSRQHAILIPAPEALYLADLESANGTWVNGQYLDPGVRYVLSAGDRIELGLLRLIVRTVSPLGRS
jgi:hypothetical protein